MDPNRPTPLLGGLTPAAFATRHWHRRPLLVRQAIADVVPPLPREALFALVEDEEVESRLVARDADGQWTLRHGPFSPRQLPSPKRPGWTLLVQGLDLHVQAAHELMARFRFLPDARLDDLMVSYASDGGGVGPHVDSYDVFLLQVEGRRRWRVGRVAEPEWLPDAPLRVLRHFEPEIEWLLEPGDMLYLPPHWAHDGTAEGTCMTASIGYRAGTRSETARDVLRGLLDAVDEEGPPDDDPRYADRGQPATRTPARIPKALQGFAREAVERLLADPGRLTRALGEVLSEPKPGVYFVGAESGSGRDSDSGSAGPVGAADTGVILDRRTRMLYDDRRLYVNGEGWDCAGADARLMRRLADARRLDAATLAAASAEALALLDAWREAGWLHALPPP